MSWSKRKANGWVQLERALSDPLGGLITAYENALREHHDVPVHNPEQLIGHLQCAAQLRNVLCHGSWQAPDGEGIRATVSR